MANTTEHISVRLPKWLVDQLREDAKTQQRSLAWILGYRLAQLSNREVVLNGKRDKQSPSAGVGESREKTPAIKPHLIVGNSAMKDPQTVYSRISHEPTCRCYRCRPPK